MIVPLVRTLQTALPQTKLTWVISRPAYDLVEGMEGVEFIVIDKPKKVADYIRFKKQLNSRRFDVLLALQTTLRANLLYPLIKAKRKIGFNTRRSDGHRWFVKEQIAPHKGHTLDGFLKFTEVLGIQEKHLRWDLPIADADYAWAKAHLPQQGPILLVNPAASKPERSWPVQHYIEVLKQAQDRWGVHIIVTGGPGAADRVLAKPILEALPAAIDLVGKTKPKQLLAVISKSQVLLCPDTGPSHMAVAVNTPVVALHAVTNPLISGPYTFQHLVVNCYPQALQTLLKRTYQHHVWGTHVHGNEAMQLIKVEDVMKNLALILD
ncbi:MAG: glycosyltransferase family 9 protein [Legionella sp.]|nr:glycosyltransferase family 9 protein [Legionella sp.]